MYSRKLHNAKLIEILDELVRVCEVYHLRYYLAYGTAIGAVRHHAIIPWDDDIDVLMPRNDLEKLLEIKDVAFGKDFQLSSYRYTDGYLYDMTKLESLSSTIIERINPIYVGGIYVDIFPLENVPDLETDKQWVRKINAISSGYSRYLICEEPKTYLVKFLYYKLKRRIFLLGKPLWKWDNIVMQYRDSETKYVKDYHCDFLHKQFFEHDVFGDGVEMEFEGKMYVIPKDYDKYLTISYGDYMQLPPEKERVLKHNYLFEDCERRLSDKELKPIIQDLKKEYYYHFSISKEYQKIINKLKRLVNS